MMTARQRCLAVRVALMNLRALAVVAVVSGVASSGCHYARGVGFAGHLPPGRPSFVAGMPEGYWIWEDRQGWHLRTTSDIQRHFHGAVQAVGGSVGALRPVGAAAGRVRRDDDTIAFDYQAEGGEQGFDWVSTGCSRFEIYIDGTTRPLRVFLGGEESSPARVPFAICG